ncbi:11K virion structural protein [Penaeus vannamei nudivirus]|nr:11K virion structural protein [Penaeus vannamei nucleopolyhedrovirus]
MQTARSYMKLECTDISKSLQISAILQMMITAIIFIMLIFAASYNNMVNPTGDEGMEKKEKYINGLVISSAVISTLLFIIGVWHVYVAIKAKKCITTTPVTRT